jgi:hypothetical protein
MLYASEPHVTQQGDVTKYSGLDLYSRICCCEDVDTDPLLLRVYFGRIMKIAIKIEVWNELDICLVAKH